MLTSREWRNDFKEPGNFLDQFPEGPATMVPGHWYYTEQGGQLAEAVLLQLVDRAINRCGKTFQGCLLIYEAFYGFKEKPFTPLPDPRFLYLAKKHGMTYAMLQDGISQQAGMASIAGEVASGRTTLTRHPLNNLEQNMSVTLINNKNYSSFSELLQALVLAFKLKFKGKKKVELFAKFQASMIKENAQLRRTELIIDESQNVAPKTLEELHMLSDVNTDRYQVLQLILVGRLELRVTMRRPQLRQFAQRTSVEYYPNARSSEESFERIRHRVRVFAKNARIPLTTKLRSPLLPVL